MAIKLIAIDMDGTLLNPQHEVTAAVKSAISRAREGCPLCWRPVVRSWVSSAI
jgi:hydroxymethylpyrimidine pyrophosphatase-like HAD family hydrolase